jgi:hypothetical protein
VFKDPLSAYRTEFAGSSKVSPYDPPAVQHGKSYQQPSAMWNSVPIAPTSYRFLGSSMLPIDAVPKSPMTTPKIDADDDGPHDLSDGDLETEEDNHSKIEQGAAQDKTSRNDDLGMVARQAKQNTQDFGLSSFTASIGRPDTQGGMANAVKEVVERGDMRSWKYVLSNLATTAQAFWQREAKIPDGKIRVRWKCVSSVYGFRMIKQLLIGS